jgi:hypothetical protein
VLRVPVTVSGKQREAAGSPETGTGSHFQMKIKKRPSVRFPLVKRKKIPYNRDRMVFGKFAGEHLKKKPEICYIRI